MTADPVRPQEALRDRIVGVLSAHQLLYPVPDEDGEFRCLCGQWIGRRRTGGTPRNLREHQADVVLPIVEEETKTLRETLREVVRINQEAITRAVKAEAAHSALRDKVKALASEERFDVAHHLAEIEPRDDLDKYILDCAIETVREIARRLRALVEEPQGGEGQ